jgi:hypothetical protein
MSVQTAPSPPPSRRRRAATTVAAALRGGLLGTVVAAVAWVVAGALAGTAFVVLVIATIGAVAYLAFRGDIKIWVWLGLAIAWAVVLLEREIVQDNGGVWVAAAGWLGVLVAARRAGISRWGLPLLAYPLASLVIVVLADEDVLDPWGSSWLWVLAVLGPVVGARTLLKQDEPPASTP